MKLTICGAGNAAHTLVPILSAGGKHVITVFTPVPGEAERWRFLLGSDGVVDLTLPDGSSLVGRPAVITDDPQVAGTDAEGILLALPAFAHELVLQSLAPFLPQNAWIIALPARSGFNWMAQRVLANHEGVIAGLQTLPWACRIHEWGRRVEVLGVKAQVDLAASPSQATQATVDRMTEMLHVTISPAPNFLALSLANTGQIIHPGIMYGLFHAWDGQPFAQDETPLFYGGVNEETAAVLQGLSNEVQQVRARLERKAGFDLSSVLPLMDWLQRAYPDQIADTSSLQSSFNSNRAYAGLRAPVRPVPGSDQDGYEPWFSARYLSEDVPFGLLVTKGIAQIAGTPTPTIDRVLVWTQERLGKEYLVDGLVTGRDVVEVAPRRSGSVFRISMHWIIELDSGSALPGKPLMAASSPAAKTVT